MNERIYRILMATGIDELDSSVGTIENCNIVGCSKGINDLYVDIGMTKPDIIIISDLLKGSENIITTITILKKEHPYTRFIYLAGSLNSRDQNRIDALGQLVLSGVYDICISKELNLELIEVLIKNPKTKDSVSYLAQHTLNNVDVPDEFSLPIFGLAQAKNIGGHLMDNVYVFTSIKPGTGKTFLSVNTACAIAKYGRKNEDGEKPKVAIIEADLQTLSIGTILNIKEDKTKNMKMVMTAISTIFDRGNLVGEESDVITVNELIKKCLVTYPELENMDILAGSTLTPEEIDSLKITPEYYIYLLDFLRKEYDVIIIDTNSSLFHITTYPLLQTASKCFYVLNLDINNIRNNLRYLGVLNKLNLTSKINWVLNENIENNKRYKSQGFEIEKLHFTADELEDKYKMKIVAKIPVIVKTVFLNRIYAGVPIVLDDDSITYTAEAKASLIDLANEIYPVEKELPKSKKHKKGFLSFLKKEVK